MLKNPNVGTPGLRFWTCDRYPYFIPSIKRIEKTSSAFPSGEILHNHNDELFVVISGTATFQIRRLNGEENFYHVAKQDIIFLMAGVNDFTVYDQSPDFEILRIEFSLYTCNDVFAQSSALDFSEALKFSITNKRMALYLPVFSSFFEGDELHVHLTEIYEEFTSQKVGFIIQVQTHLLQLLLAMIRKAREELDEVLKDIGAVGISSKFSSYSAMKKDCILQLSDFEIYDVNPHNNNAAIVSRYLTRHAEKQNPTNSDLEIDNCIDKTLPIESKTSLILNSNNDTIYHVWLFPDRSHFVSDIRKYSDSGYLRFYAKCNMELRFGIVLYNRNNNKCISHTITIKPSDTYSEFCIPILDAKSPSKTSPHLRSIIDYIKQNYSKKILLEDIAEFTHLNPSYLSSLFKEQTGLTLSDYILDYRLSVAKKLLVNSPILSISQVALTVGFYDSAHFSKAFKNRFGLTAREYRNKNVKRPR